MTTLTNKQRGDIKVNNQTTKLSSPRCWQFHRRITKDDHRCNWKFLLFCIKIHSQKVSRGFAAGFEDVGNKKVPPRFCRRLKSLERVPGVIPEWDSSLAEQHLGPNSFVGEDLLVGEADTRTREVVLVGRGSPLVIVLFISGKTGYNHVSSETLWLNLTVESS